MKYIAKRFQNKQTSLSLDTKALAAYPNLIDLSIGDTDFITDQRVIDAAFADASAGATRYGRPQGDPELIATIAKAWQEDYNQVIPQEEILITASSCLGMSLALMATLNPDDEIIVFGPYFSLYRQQIEMSGGKCVEVITEQENGYDVEEAKLRYKITNKTRGIIINNPTNPTGIVYSKETLEMLVKIAQEYDLIIYADEIYTSYLFDGKFIPIRTLEGAKERTITFNSFSKNFMMTGWRVGCIIAPQEIVNAISYVNGAMIYTAPSISQRAAIKALLLREEIAKMYISQYKERVKYMSDRIESIPYFSLVRPKGTFYLFPSIKATRLTDKDFCQLALKEAQVLVTPGSAFGMAGEGHIRIACTAKMEQLEIGMDRMAKLRV